MVYRNWYSFEFCGSCDTRVITVSQLKLTHVTLVADIAPLCVLKQTLIISIRTHTRMFSIPRPHIHMRPLSVACLTHPPTP